jgi:hypothetical protein
VQDLGMEAMCWLLIACTEVGDLSVGPALLPFMHHILLPIALVVTSDEAKTELSPVSDLLPWPQGDEEQDAFSKSSLHLGSSTPSSLTLSKALSRPLTPSSAGLPLCLTSASDNLKVRILGAMIKVLADTYFKSKCKSKKPSDPEQQPTPLTQVILRVQASESVADLLSLVRHLDKAQEKDAQLLDECFKAALRLWRPVRLNFTALYPWTNHGEKSLTRKKVGRPPSSSRASEEVWKGALLLTYLRNLIHRAAASDGGQSSLSLVDLEASVASCVSVAAAAAPLLPEGRIKMMLFEPVDLRKAKAAKKGGIKRRIDANKKIRKLEEGDIDEGLKTTSHLVSSLPATE